MKELSLQELREIELSLLKKFDAFCAENNIRYFLSNGTLLGAVKYNGFIPWDDDVDVLVPRDDYERLVELFCDDERYKLFAFEKNSDYRYPFAKLCDMQTRKVELNFDNGVQLGVDIDIFPLDNWNDSLYAAKKEMRYIYNNIFYLSLEKMQKPDSLNPGKRIMKRIMMSVCKIFGGKFFIKRIVRKSCAANGTNSEYAGCKSWCIYKEKEIIPSEVFSQAVDVDFEGVKFPAPVGYDVYLRSLYGDYENDPPVEERRTHHGFKAYRI